jgi:hypothetical protein
MGQYGESRQRTLRAVRIDRLTGICKSKTRFPGITRVERIQVNCVPVRDPISTGVQVPPKLSVKIKTWNVETLSLRLVQRKAGITVRRVVGVAGLRG